MNQRNSSSFASAKAKLSSTYYKSIQLQLKAQADTLIFIFKFCLIVFFFVQLYCVPSLVVFLLLAQVHIAGALVNDLFVLLPFLLIAATEMIVRDGHP